MRISAIGWRLGAVIVVTLLVVACSSNAEETKETPETRCQRICTPDAKGPCATRTDPSCTSTCVARLSGKTDACQSCLHGKSGWMGVSCTCDQAFGGFGSASCKTCRWHGSGAACSGEAFGSCSSVATGCQGLVIAPVGGPDCASSCGEEPIVDAGAAG